MKYITWTGDEVIIMVVPKGTFDQAHRVGLDPLQSAKQLFLDHLHSRIVARELHIRTGGHFK